MRYLKKILPVLLVVLRWTGGQAQSVFLPHDPDLYHGITRAEIKTRGMNGAFHSAVRPLARDWVMALIDTLRRQPGELSPADRLFIRNMQESNSEWVKPGDLLPGKGLWKGRLFARKADFLSYSDSTFDVHANVVGLGTLGRNFNDPKQERTYANIRGMEVRGTIGKRVGFYSFLTENQVFVPGYVQDWTRQYNSVPHDGFWKRFGKNGYDFMTARGYITFRTTPYIQWQAGHDRLHIGNGYRSLILSDFGNNYTFLRITTQIWKFQYTNLYASLKGDLSVGPSGTPGSRTIPGKYLFLHRLGMNIGKSLNLGLFESVIASPNASTGGTITGGNGLDLAYLNPIIFYRSVEQNAGSPDNACLGFDFKWNRIRNLQLYGQFFLDEFLLKEIKAQNGWWGNKFGVQAGLHYLDAAGVDNLDLQLEYNRVRPFTYTHLDQFRAYTHYSQPLAHPLGANFSEWIAILRYPVLPRLQTSLRVIHYRKGLDPAGGANAGGNIFRSYAQNRLREYGNEIGQGLENKVWLSDLTISWQFIPNLFAEFRFLTRLSELAGKAEGPRQGFLTTGIRWNIPQRQYDF